MKIHFDGVSFLSRTGPNTFASRLALQLSEMGHRILTSADSADLSLVFIQPSGAKLSPVTVQRLDGIWFKPDQFFQNAPIQRFYRQASGVVFQSNFDQQMIEKWFGQRSHIKCISNGIKRQLFDTSKISKSLIDMGVEYLFVSSANWHGQKRLKANIELYEMLSQRLGHEKTKYVIFGDASNVKIDVTNALSDSIAIAGSQNVEQCLYTYACANAMLHLAWLDHCPNTVVEALSQGCPVICSSSGGTKEMVKDSGFVIDDEIYDFGLMDYDNPPKINLENVVDKIIDSGILKKRVNPDNIDIKDVAESYVSFFESILSK